MSRPVINFYGNQCNSARTDEDFSICWDPEDEILLNNDEGNIGNILQEMITAS